MKDPSDRTISAFLFCEKCKLMSIRAPPCRVFQKYENFNSRQGKKMKLLSTTIIELNGAIKKITVCVDDATAETLALCSEDIRQIYILEEYKDQKLTRGEMRRHFSYEEILENGIDFPSYEDTPWENIIRSERNAELYTAMNKLTDKQYHVLWKHAVEGLTYMEIAAEMGIRWDTVREYYHVAVRKIKKYLKNVPKNTILWQ